MVLTYVAVGPTDSRLRRTRHEHVHTPLHDERAEEFRGRTSLVLGRGQADLQSIYPNTETVLLPAVPVVEHAGQRYVLQRSG